MSSLQYLSVPIQTTTERLCNGDLNIKPSLTSLRRPLGLLALPTLYPPSGLQDLTLLFCFLDDKTHSVLVSALKKIVYLIILGVCYKLALAPLICSAHRSQMRELQLQML